MTYRLALAVALLLAVTGTASAATPIPQNPSELTGLPIFTGQAATPQPVKASKPPRHPFMAANGRNSVHNDAYQTDTYRYAGPLGREHPVDRGCGDAKELVPDLRLEVKLPAALQRRHDLGRLVCRPFPACRRPLQRYRVSAQLWYPPMHFRAKV